MTDDKPSYEKLELMHHAAQESLETMARENSALRAVIQGQVAANDALGLRDRDRHEIMTQQLLDHNGTVQSMAEEIERLRAMVVRLGGDPDEE